MSASTSKQLRHRAKWITEPRNLRLDGLGDWLAARETGHRATPRSSRSGKKELATKARTP